MPNQLNYPIPLTGTTFQRPSRLTAADLKLIGQTNRQILFGTNDRDVVELWVYNNDGSFAGHINLGATDTALSVNTLIDNTGPYEVLNIDLKDASLRMDIQPGRYVMVANFFRDEVGSEAGYQLYIVDISDDRSELRLSPINPDAQTAKDIFEFVVPSVPRQFAKGLIDQLYGKEVEGDPNSEIKVTHLESELDDVIDRVHYADATASLHSIFDRLVLRTYPLVFHYMAEDVFNLNIQRIELEGYIEKALETVIYGMVQSGEIDPRFVII